MAVPLPFPSLQFSPSLNRSNHKLSPQNPPPSLPLNCPSPSLSLSLFTRPKLTPHPTRFAIRATENGAQTENEADAEQATGASSAEIGAGGEELSELGAEIKRAMKEREKGDDGLLSGVAEEIGEIEWPDFGKVLGTTGVVLGVIAGSSVVLLTLNAVLAEFSDKIFAGKGVQDFFGG